MSWWEGRRRQRFSRGHLARTRSRTRPLVEFFRGRGRDEGRNFSLFLGLFEDEMRNSSEFWPFPQPFMDETFDPYFLRLRTRPLVEFFRGRGRDEERNFSLFLGLFEDEMRNSSEFWPFSQPF